MFNKPNSATSWSIWKQRRMKYVTMYGKQKILMKTFSPTNIICVYNRVGHFVHSFILSCWHPINDKIGCIFIKILISTWSLGIVWHEWPSNWWKQYQIWNINEIQSWFRGNMNHFGPYCPYFCRIPNMDQNSGPYLNFTPHFLSKLDVFSSKSCCKH